MAVKHLRCYAHGHGDSWEAICIDLDIAVQGRSLEEVKHLLNAAVDSYVDDAAKETPATAARLLNRKAPLLTRAKLGFAMLAYSLAATRPRDHQASFELPCRV